MGRDPVAGEREEDADSAAARAVLREYAVEPRHVVPFGAGLINRTFLVQCADGAAFVLQRVNPIFPAAVHEDIEAVTTHLARKGLTVPRLVRTRAGELCVRARDGTWRLLTRVEGESRAHITRPAEAESAGALLAAFHGALADLDHEFRNPRAGVHDTPRHLARLREAMERHGSDPCLGTVLPLGERILQAAARLPALPRLPDRIVHGDPKISNVLFRTGTDTALCLVDLDTLGRMPLPLEMGDALRSWCNPAGEDSRDGTFSVEMFEAAMRGYAREAAGWIDTREVEAILPATLTICVELAARFCADALDQDYFGWDPARFSSHSEHSEVRAAGQLAVYASLQAQAREVEDTLRTVFAR
jgi:Ser/Thr protein kinase RdoA (MazF antagonist)